MITLGRRTVQCILLAATLSPVTVRFVHAQDSFAVTGLITDSIGTALSQAAIVVLSQVDSTLVQFGTSHNDGAFLIRNLPSGLYILQASHIGMQMTLLDFEIQGYDVNIGQVIMSPQVQALEEFVVTSERLPYVVRGDTIEFDAMVFSIRPQDMVEDMLAKLPGVRVGQSGAIFVHGERISTVLVDGKEFFSADYTIATRNLPADAVEKVQVFDKPSGKEELTGVPDGQEEKALNLTLTEEARRGAFGHTTGGLGATPSNQHIRYFNRASVFRFSQLKQLAVIGNADNVNRPGFSPNQLRSFQGIEMINRPDDGISESLGAGVNLDYSTGENSSINGSYFLTNYSNTRDMDILRQEILGTGRTVFGDESRIYRNSDLRHMVMLHTDIRIEEGHDLKFEGTLSNNHSVAKLSDLEQIRNSFGVLINGATANTNDEQNALSAQAKLVWRKRISPKGRSIIAVSTANVDEGDGIVSLVSDTGFHEGDVRHRDELHQKQELHRNHSTFGQRIELLQPISARRNLSIYLHRNTSLNRRDKTYFDLIDTHNIVDPSLSRKYRQYSESWRSGIELSLRSADRSWWIWTKIAAKHSFRRGAISAREQSIRSRFTYAILNVTISKEFNRIGSISVRYGTKAHEPSLQQLQPFTDNTDPLRYFSGNPELTPAYEHELGLQYYLKKPHSGISIFTDLSTEIVRNNIIYERKVETNLRQLLRPINRGSMWSANHKISFEMPIHFLDMDWSLNNRLRLESGTGLINGQENESWIIHSEPMLGVNYYLHDTFELDLSGGLIYNKIQYSLNKELDQSNISSAMEAEAYWELSENWSFESSFLYRVFDQNLFGKSEKIIRMDMSVSRLLFSGRGDFQLELNDVFNRNIGAIISNDSYQIERSRTRSLGRYLLLKLTYKPRRL
ncbi:MAG: TonB-dependent receptor [Bacteroidetes bacterium]|nr:TonB-dependent receptor [Bacteroidota bacterium]